MTAFGFDPRWSAMMLGKVLWEIEHHTDHPMTFEEINGHWQTLQDLFPHPKMRKIMNRWARRGYLHGDAPGSMIW